MKASLGEGAGWAADPHRVELFLSVRKLEKL